MSKAGNIIKGILIDSEKRELREVELNRGDCLGDIRKFVNCDYIDVVRSCLRGLPDYCGDDIFVDDEGLLREDGKNYFILPVRRSTPMAGNGLILGADRSTGETVGHSMTARNIEYLRENIRFTSDSEIEQLKAAVLKKLDKALAELSHA